jgi:hypothetical protein
VDANRTRALLKNYIVILPFFVIGKLYIGDLCHTQKRNVVSSSLESLSQPWKLSVGQHPSE